MCKISLNDHRPRCYELALHERYFLWRIPVQCNNKCDCMLVNLFMDTRVNTDLPERTIGGVPVPMLQPKLFDGGVLRDYQVDGFKWLTVMFAA